MTEKLEIEGKASVEGGCALACAGSSTFGEGDRETGGDEMGELFALTTEKPAKAGTRGPALMAGLRERERENTECEGGTTDTSGPLLMPVVIGLNAVVAVVVPALVN